MAEMKIAEPLIAHGMSYDMLDSEIELVRAARKGVSTTLLWDFLKVIHSSKAEFESLLPYSLKTFSRKNVLDEAMGERILNIIKVFKKGEEVFGNVAVFKKWLEKHHPVLGEKPKNFLNTTTGCQLIISELGRAIHGVTA